MHHRFVAPTILVCFVVLSPVGAQVVDWVSIGTGGAAGTGDSGLEDARRAISADGRFVVFESAADNLVADDLNGDLDVFRRDLVLGTTVRVSVSSTGSDALGPSENPSISGDGRYIAFASTNGSITFRSLF